MPSTRPALLLTALLVLTACGNESEPASAPSSPPSPAPSGPAQSGPAPSATAAPAPTPAPTGPRVLASGLEAPWGLAFLPGGDALVSERDSTRIVRVPAAGGDPVEVARVDETRPGGEGGLLGLAVSPTFATDGQVFAYLTGEDDNRIVRFSLTGDQTRTTVLDGIPKGRIHNGGRLAFGPDGMLYAGTGDTGETAFAQDPDSLGGKVLRMTPAGAPAPGATSVVFSGGHRNVQGLAFDDAGRLYATEFGQDRFDEVNQVVEGDNGGWPEVEGAGDGGGRFAAPIVTWETSESSPSGAAVAGDFLYVAALRGQRLWQVPLDGQGGAGEPVALLDGDYGRIRTVATAPDGSLWVLTSNRDGRGDPADDDDRLLRVTPAG